ncbi:hypothetical protein BC834DRAFT_971147 [Gloeopeniophorella convolvens]|nr:hypothetical protein BC834DRAFT_971147 [Gloeopeniophorella convolvens]
MAAVAVSQQPRHPSPFRKVQKISRSTNPAHGPSTVPGGSDPFHGHEVTAKLCAHFVSHLFACPELPPPPVPPSTTPTPRLDHFIAYALHRTRLHTSVTFAALYLLQRLKARFPAAKGSSGHRLFISAFMLASKIICDDTYSNKSWCIVGQGMFALREINQMEREMCSYLEWQLNVDPTTLRDFEARVRRDFQGPGPYPTVVLPPAAPASFAHPTSSTASTIPSFTPRVPMPKDSAPVIPSPAYTSSPPDTPPSSHSASTSPASSASPGTPPDAHGPAFAVKVVSADSSPVGAPVIPHAHAMRAPAVAAKPTKTTAAAAVPAASAPPQKPKTIHGQYAYAARAVW